MLYLYLYYKDYWCVLLASWEYYTLSPINQSTLLILSKIWSDFYPLKSHRGCWVVFSALSSVCRPSSQALYDVMTCSGLWGDSWPRGRWWTHRSCDCTGQQRLFLMHNRCEVNSCEWVNISEHHQHSKTTLPQHKSSCPIKIKASESRISKWSFVCMWGFSTSLALFPSLYWPPSRKVPTSESVTLSVFPDSCLHWI